MAVQLKLSNLGRVTQAQIQSALSPLGKVTSVKISGTTCIVEIEGDVVQKAVGALSRGEMWLGDLELLDSTGLGELEKAKISLV